MSNNLNRHNLASNNFLLGIQTKFQCDALVEFWKNGVCMDTTHATNQYDFFLLTYTFLVYGESIYQLAG